MAKAKAVTAPKQRGNLPTSGYTHQTPQNYMLNAGAWVKNLKWDSEKKEWVFDLIGATSGGSTITLKNEYRQVEVDGAFGGTVGSDMIESIECTAEMNLLEATVENFKMALLADQTESDGIEFPAGYQVIKPRSQVKNEDYIKNLAYVGTIAGAKDKQPVIIIFSNAICTSGLELNPQDKAEAVITVTFEGRAGECDLDKSAMPVTILFPEVEKLTPPDCGNDKPEEKTEEGK